jgi:hypothetical protein
VCHLGYYKLRFEFKLIRFQLFFTKLNEPEPESDFVAAVLAHSDKRYLIERDGSLPFFETRSWPANDGGYPI